MVEDQALKEVLDLAEAINKFGPIAVILSVLLLVFLAVILYFLRTSTSSNNQMMKQQQQLINNLLEQTKREDDREEKASYDEKNIVEIFYKLNSYLKSECKKFLDKTECDRIGIYVFHNGTVASHGLPFFKVSCICEYIRRGSGICSHIADSTNLPLTLFDDIVERLYTEGTVIVRNTIDGQFHSESFFLDKDKASTALFSVVYDSEDNTMAFVLGEYRAELSDAEIEHDLEIYSDLCARLKPVLEFSEYQKLKSGK